MNQLKKIFLGLAVVVALGSVGANNAAAQASCTANSVPTLVRSQGIAELTGSIILNCTTPAVTTASSLTVTIQPSAAVITNNPATPGAATATCTLGTQTAPTAFIPTITITSIGATTFTGIGAGAAATCVGTPSGNTITFPVPAQLTAAGGAFTLTIGVAPSAPIPANTVGIRTNVFASGITFPAQIAALLTSSPSGVIAVTNNFLNVAIPQAGLSASTAFTSGGGLAQCTTPILTGTPTAVAYTGGTGFTAVDPVKLGAGKVAVNVPNVSVVEGFPSAFAVAASAAEAAYSAGSVTEGADSTQGTRITLTFGALPSNVVLVAANFLSTTGLTANSAVSAGNTTILSLVSGAGADGNGGAPAIPATPATPLGTGATVISGNTVTYEVIQTSTAAAETIVIPVAIYTVGTPSPGGTSTLSVQLAPTSTIGTAIVNPIPRFGSVPFSGNALAVIPCLSNIFFPWVANTAGYDTGFALANTTTDVFGTAAQSGTCVYNFFGTNAPSGGTFTTPAFGGGTVDTRLLSNIAPGFFGYVIVVCNFQLGHGFDFIVNGFGGGTTTVGEGGPGLIILQPGTTAALSRKGLASAGVGGALFGEALGH